MPIKKRMGDPMVKLIGLIHFHAIQSCEGQLSFPLSATAQQYTPLWSGSDQPDFNYTSRPTILPENTSESEVCIKLTVLLTAPL